MKEELSEESRLSLVNYRLDRAKETMKEAELLKKECFYNAAVNRFIMPVIMQLLLYY